MKKERSWGWTIAYIAIIALFIVLAIVFFSLNSQQLALFNEHNPQLINARGTPDEAYWQALVDQDTLNYRVFGILAYVCSLLCLIAFGLILKHAGYRKEKAEKEALQE